MRKCPNCGQPTARTEDWACQWCGYPLLSKSYKKIPKTYKQVKEERLYKPEPTAEPAVEESVEIALVVEPEKKPKKSRRRRVKAVAPDETKSVSEPESKPRPKSEPEPISTAVEVTVDELFSAYEADEAEADARFNNKILRVTGIVNNIKVMEYLIYMNLTGAGERVFPEVLCFFDSEYAAELNQLTVGQQVTVQGEYHGSIVSSSMRNCVLVP